MAGPNSSRQRAQVGLGVVDEDHGVRIAHRDGGHLEARPVRGDRRAHRALAAARLHRDLAAREPRAAHLDRDRSHLAVVTAVLAAVVAGLGVDRAREQARVGVDAQHRAAHRRVALVKHLGDAANAVAAHLRLAAIGVEHAHARVTVDGRQDRQNAVGADAEVAIAHRAHDRRLLDRHGSAIRGSGAVAQVDDDEVVTQAFDFGEGEGGHDRA